MKIEISQDNLGTLCICAIRYCMGRMSYMPSLVQGIVSGLLPHLSDQTIGVMRDDCDFQRRTKQYGDERIDKPGWIRWRDLLEEEKARRKANESAASVYSQADR